MFLNRINQLIFVMEALLRYELIIIYIGFVLQMSEDGHFKSLTAVF